MAFRALPAPLGIPRGGRRPAAALARAPGPLVQPGGLLPPAWFWRSTRQVPNRSTVENPPYPRPSSGTNRRSPARRRRGRRLLDHVAACGRRFAFVAPAIATRSVAAAPPADQGRQRSTRQARRERTRRDVAGRCPPPAR